MTIEPWAIRSPPTDENTRLREALRDIAVLAEARWRAASDGAHSLALEMIAKRAALATPGAPDDAE